MAKITLCLVHIADISPSLVFVFNVRATFGLDTCLFPQCVQAFISLIGGMKVFALPVLPGRWGQWAVHVGRQRLVDGA